MTLIDGDRIITAQLYDDEHEEFKEQKMSIIDYVNAYTDEGVTMADDVLDKIRKEVNDLRHVNLINFIDPVAVVCAVIEIIDKYREEQE